MLPFTARYPEAARFVEETFPSADWPEIFSDTPCKNPDAVMFVEETFVSTAFVEFKVGKVP